MMNTAFTVIGIDALLPAPSVTSAVTEPAPIAVTRPLLLMTATLVGEVAESA